MVETKLQRGTGSTGVTPSLAAYRFTPRQFYVHLSRGPCLARPPLCAASTEDVTLSFGMGVTELLGTRISDSSSQSPMPSA